MKVLGIDPGLSGGLAFIEAGSHRPFLLHACDVPVAGEGAKRRVVASIVIALIQKYAPDHAFIERAQAMPDQGASSGFNYGRAVGALEASVEGMQIPLTIIESTAWKKFHGLIKREKEDSRQRALMLFPGSLAFQRKMDHNRAESALIAYYGMATLTSVPSPQSPKAASVRRGTAQPSQGDLLDRATESG